MPLQRLPEGDPNELMRVTVSLEYIESFQRAFPGVGNWRGNNFVYQARRGDIKYFEEGARRHKRLLDQYGSPTASNQARPAPYVPPEKFPEVAMQPREGAHVEWTDEGQSTQRPPQATMQQPAHPPSYYPQYLSQHPAQPQPPLNQQFPSDAQFSGGEQLPAYAPQPIYGQPPSPYPPQYFLPVTTGWKPWLGGIIGGIVGGIASGGVGVMLIPILLSSASGSGNFSTYESIILLPELCCGGGLPVGGFIGFQWGKSSYEGDLRRAGVLPQKPTDGPPSELQRQLFLKKGAYWNPETRRYEFRQP